MQNKHLKIYRYLSIRCVKLLHNFSGKKSQRLAQISQILRVYQPQMHLRLKIRERKRGHFIAPRAGGQRGARHQSKPQPLRHQADLQLGAGGLDVQRKPQPLRLQFAD